MRIGIIGLGYVGLTLAIAAADCGIDVYGVEINEKIKEALSHKKAHFFEPGLDTLIEKYSGNRFNCVEKFPTDEKFDAFIITVGTPLLKGSSTPNFDYIKSALQSIKHCYTGEELIILRSTVSVGTTRNIVMPFLAELCGKSEEEIHVAFCPERTVEGKAIDELKNLPQIISGNNEDALETAENVFRKLTPFVIRMDCIEEAELVKLYNNTYRDMTFALGNVFCMAAQTFGIDGNKVITAANKGYSRSNICLPGFVGGPCLEKDAYILTNNMKECSSRDFILSARKFNESLEDMVVDWVKMKVPAGGTVALSGMAFKGVPETSDLRGSNSVNIAQKLVECGFKLRLHDFVASVDEMKELNVGEVCADVYSCAEGASALLVLNNNKKYAGVAYNSKLAGISILDVWNCCNELKNSEADICNMGNMFI